MSNLDILLPKQENKLPKPDNKIPVYQNDRVLKMVLIPLFALAVPNLTGLIDYNYAPFTIVMHYCFFLIISMAIFYGNRFILFQLSDRFDWFFSPFRKVLTLLAGIILYTLPVTIFLVGLFYICLINKPVDEIVLRNVCLMNVICVIFVAHIYETVFLIKHTESEMLRTAKVEKAKAQAELEALKGQIDPHFIFNSLNTLSHLILQAPEKAKLFNDKLADVYRYILQNKNRQLVFLSEEIKFLENYFALLNIRFGESIQLDNRVNEIEQLNYLLPPISIQILLENCVKHNAFSITEPMLIAVYIENNMLVCNNRSSTKKPAREGTGTGLINLSSRYRLITDKDIIIHAGQSFFEVKLPLLTT